MGHVKFLELKNINDCNCYEVFAKLKQHRLHFLTSETISSTSFELLHMDLWDPYHVKSILGAQYLHTFVDDHSKSVWSFLLAHKNLVPQTLRNFLMMIRNHFDRKVKFVRSDNGIEFTNHDCGKLFGELGIIHQRSSPYTPQ